MAPSQQTPSQSGIRVCSSCGQQNRIPARHLADSGRCGRCKAALPPQASPIEVDADAFAEITAGAKVPVLVDFWAAWCGPCRMAAPELKKVASNKAGSALVLKVDTERHPQLAQRFGVQGIPHFVVLKDGKTVFSQAGLVNHRQMERWLEQA